MVAAPLLVYTPDGVPGKARGLGERLCTPASVALLTAGTYCRALISWFVTPTVEFVPTGLPTERWSRGAAVESAVERFLGAGLLTGALLSGQAVLAVLGAAALA